jgi:hypothetical protein
MLGHFVDNTVWKSRGERVSVVRWFGRGVLVCWDFAGFHVCWRMSTEKDIETNR